MVNQSVETLVAGGAATAAPPLGPALGPLGVNISQVVAEINQRTVEMKGMQVPIKVIVDTATKDFKIEVGTPPASALIKKEAGVEKGSGNPLTDKVADVMIEQIIKIAKIKDTDLLGRTLKSRVKEVVGTCHSMGILVEGLSANEALRAIEAGKFDAEIDSGKTELSVEEKKHLEEEKKRLHEEMEKRRAEFEVRAKQIMKEQEGKEPKKIRTAMLEAGVPLKIVDELVPIQAAGGAVGGVEAGVVKK